MKRLRKVWQFVQRENFHRLLGVLLLLVILSSFLVHRFEPDISLKDAVWWSIVTLTTVGYGDISPTTLGGQIIAVIIMFFGIGVLGMFSGILASILVEHKIKVDKGMTHHHLKDHIILCEWNYRAQAVLKELRLDSQAEETPVVLIASIESKPLDDDDLYFVQGEVNDETLGRANLAEAKTVLILGDDRLDPTARDAKVVLNTLTVESVNPQVYTIVELLDEANVKHCERAQANEIIVNNELSSGLISRAALNHGISKVLSEILSSQFGNELYKLAVPGDLHGQHFIEGFTQIKKAHGGTVLAIQQGQNGPVLCNPASNYQLRAEDYLILIAEEKPNWQL